MRHWLYGGRTELVNLVLLCDADHGLDHEHDLVLARRNGRLIVTTPDGLHIWGTANAAFSAGLPGVDSHRAADVTGGTDPFVGVGPIDTLFGRRPTGTPAGSEIGDVDPPLGRVLRRRFSPPRAGRPANRSHGRLVALAAVPPARETGRLRHVLFPDGEPTLADSLQERYDRMDLRFAVGVLMGNRDLVRRLAAEAGLPASG